jgi:hypothetical protein
VPGEVSNLIIYTLDAPQLFGTTNELYGESFRVGPPIDPDDVTPKNYVDGLFQTTAWWSAQQPVQLNSHSLHYSGSWEVYPNYTTNSDQLHFSWLGTDLVRLDNPMGAFQTFASIDLVGTNVLVSVPTNGLAQAPALRYTRYLTPLNWLAVSATNWIDGTNYVLQFGRPFTDSGYVSAYAVSTNAAVMSVAGDLSVAGAWRGAVCTVTNSNSTTWGLGAGVMRWDTNYVYVSVATNRWKRAALSTW